MQWPNDRNRTGRTSIRADNRAPRIQTLAGAILITLIDVCSGPAGAQVTRALQLDVTMNGVPANLIGTFSEMEPGHLAATSQELEELGIKADQQEKHGLVPLDRLSGLSYRYDDRTQSISIEVAEDRRVRRRFDVRPTDGRRPKARADWGAVLNYDLTGTIGSLERHRLSSLGDTSVTLEARAFSPYGTLEQSGIVRAGPRGSADALRLDTSVRHSDEDRLITYRAGDLVSGGLAWSRPLRLGGIQAESNFGLRPDLVTTPLPTIEGSAAVPSTVDVYVNSIKAFSKDVGTGPFSIGNIPVVTGSGEAQLVIRDPAGRETRTVLRFFSSPSLLASGTTEWSIEGGLPRLSYGTSADEYAQSPVGSATLRGGLSNAVTGQLHLEGGAELINGGVGAVFRTGSLGVAALAISGSDGPFGVGFGSYLAYETKLFDLTLNASSQMSFGAFDDLASITASRRSSRLQAGYDPYGYPYHDSSQGSGQAGLARALGPGSARLPRALHRLTASTPLPFDERSSLSANFISLKDTAGNRSTILAGSYSRSLPFNASIYGTLFHDFGTRRNTGLFVGLSVPFGTAASASSGYSRNGRSGVATTDIVRSLGPEAGSYGWRLHDAEGAAPYREASGSYRSGFGTLQAVASRDRTRSSAALGLRGAIAALNGEVFASDWIDDGFAVVKVGAPGIDVLSENRLIGRTTSSGSLLVPTLRSYGSNRLAVDPLNLPVDAEIDKVREIVAPADRAGVVVDFRARSTTNAALVVFTRPDGSALPVGSTGRIGGSGAEFIIGYDGEAFVKELGETAEAVVETPSGICRAMVPFRPLAGQQVRIVARCQ